MYNSTKLILAWYCMTDDSSASWFACNWANSRNLGKEKHGGNTDNLNRQWRSVSTITCGQWLLDQPHFPQRQCEPSCLHHWECNSVGSYNGIDY